jgi:WD40 repeat protein
VLNFTAPGAVNAVVCSADGASIFSGCDGDQENLSWWNIRDVDWNDPEVKSVEKSDLSDKSINSIMSLALNHDDSKLVSGSQNGSLILWNMEVGTKQLLARYTASVNSVAFSHDNKNILVGLSGSKANVELWDISNINRITHSAFTGLWNDVYTVAFSPDDKIFLVGGKYYSLVYSTLIKWENLTDQQAALVNRLKEYNVDHLRLIYKLCLISLKDQTNKLNLDSEERVIFKNLEDGMQKLLRDLRLIKK